MHMDENFDNLNDSDFYTDTTFSGVNGKLEPPEDASEHHDGTSTSTPASIDRIVLEESTSRPFKRWNYFEDICRSLTHLDLTGNITVSYTSSDPNAVIVFGASADICRGECTLPGETAITVAVKRIRSDCTGFEKELEFDALMARNVSNELRIWSQLNHANILPLIGFTMDLTYPTLVSKWVDDGSLRQSLNSLDRNEALAIVGSGFAYAHPSPKNTKNAKAIGVAKGVAYLHSNNIVHADIKSENILLSPNREPLIIDFGVSRADSDLVDTTHIVEVSNHNAVGTIRWLAKEFFSFFKLPPEELERQPRPQGCNKATDIWAFGMTIYELLSYDLPYVQISNTDQVCIHISMGNLPPTPECFSSSAGYRKDLESGMWSVCEKCWNFDPASRPSISSLVDELERIRLAEVTLDDEETTDSLEITIPVMDVNEELEMHPIPRPSSAELLNSVLFSRPHLDLTGKVLVEKTAMRKKYGGGADVYEGVILVTGEKVAVKRLRLSIDSDKYIAKHIAKEIRIWSELDHPNIMPILGYIIEGDYPSLVSIWMMYGSLRDYMTKLDRKETISIALGIARGLAYVHERNAVHSNVKADNVLISPEKQALLTDFGVSRMDSLSAGYTTHSAKGSTRWQAYEFFDIFEDDSPAPQHTQKTDIWAFGMTVYELLTHKLPYYYVSENTQVINYISRGRLPKEPPPSTNPEDAKVESFLWSLCNECWNRDPNLRPSMENIEKMIEAF